MTTPSPDLQRERDERFRRINGVLWPVLSIVYAFVAFAAFGGLEQLFRSPNLLLWGIAAATFCIPLCGHGIALRLAGRKHPLLYAMIGIVLTLAVSVAFSAVGVGVCFVVLANS